LHARRTDLATEIHASARLLRHDDRERHALEYVLVALGEIGGQFCGRTLGRGNVADIRQRDHAVGADANFLVEARLVRKADEELVGGA